MPIAALGTTNVLRDYEPSDDVWPTEWIPGKLDVAKARFAEYLEHEVGNL
jgi:acyl-CoA dehydrogenase